MHGMNTTRTPSDRWGAFVVGLATVLLLSGMQWITGGVIH
jgi:hypothetical protein